MSETATSAFASAPMPPAETTCAATAAPKPWSPLTRVLFRMAFIYFALFVFACGNGSLFQMWPGGGWIDDKLTWPLLHVAEWVGRHWFHLTGFAATNFNTGSGDTALNWIYLLLMVLVAGVGGLVWTAVSAARGNTRVEYTTAYGWLRFLLRLSTGMFMMNYGLDKLYPFQMSKVTLAVLNEPVGNMSPMTMLWSLIGMNPAYEMICGAAEVLGGLMILFRRTALAGALVSSFVMVNVLLYNLFFDVPVKLFAGELLLALLFITLPDVPALFRFFWMHQPAVPCGVWIPPAERTAFRRVTRGIELVFVATFLVWAPIQMGIRWHKTQAAIRAGSPLVGGWSVDVRSGSFFGGESDRITAIYMDDPVHGMSRGVSGGLWRTRTKVDAKANTVVIGEYGLLPDYTYTIARGDGDHMVLSSMVPKDAAEAKTYKPVVLALTRIPLPTHYPLTDRGFHWVNDWGLER